MKRIIDAWLEEPRAYRRKWIVKTYAIELVGSGFVKIGASDNPAFRLCSFKTISPFELRVIGTIRGDREAEMHHRFSDRWVRGEWFKISQEIREAFKTKEKVPRTHSAIFALLSNRWQVMSDVVALTPQHKRLFVSQQLGWLRRNDFAECRTMTRGGPIEWRLSWSSRRKK